MCFISGPFSEKEYWEKIRKESAKKREEFANKYPNIKFEDFFDPMNYDCAVWADTDEEIKEIIKLDQEERKEYEENHKNKKTSLWQLQNIQ